MKAKKVYETQGFQRDKDITKSLGIGKHREFVIGDVITWNGDYRHTTNHPLGENTLINVKRIGKITRFYPDGSARMYYIHPDPGYPGNGYIESDDMKDATIWEINETQGFQRSGDLTKSLDVGINRKDAFKNIDSDDLESVAMLVDFGEEEYLDSYEEEQEEGQLQLAETKAKYKLLEPYIELGEGFDWKEEEDMDEYIEKNRKGRYVYNAMPGSDSYQVVFSTIELPSAELIN